MALVQQAPTLFLSFEATQTLRDCHRVAPKDNGTLLRDAVAAARSYALWDYAGLATRDRKALEARLEELQRCDPGAKVSEDAFVAAVIHGARVGVPPRPRPKRLVDADASWEAYRARLEKLSLGSTRYDVAPGTPRAPSPPPPLDAAARRLPAAELAAFSPRAARAKEERGWERRKAAREAHVEKRRQDHLQRIRAEQEAEERRRAAAAGPARLLALANRAKDPIGDDDRRKAHRAIRAPDRQLVAEMLGKNSPVEVLRFVNAEVFGEHTQRLSPSGWLVDEVVNYYMFLLQERDALVCASDSSRKPCHFFNSFFFTKLLENGSYNYRQVKRWTKRFDLFSRSKVFAPVNVGNMHWCMVMVDVARKEVRYFDSMGAGGEPYLKAMKRYLEDEHRTKKGSELEGGWTLTRTTRDTPRQTNGYDCGVFMTHTADYLSRDGKLDFNQAEMTYARRLMVWQILNKTLL